MTIQRTPSETVDTLLSADPIWVDSDEQLCEVCLQWSDIPAIAVDTEFIRTDTFYPIPALIQVCDGRATYLIDPKCIENFAPLNGVLTNSSVIKIFHSCSEDLEVFQSFLGVVPAPIFDTQLAAAYAGYDYSMGYARLVNTLLGVEIPKDVTRSDWLVRPLSSAQIHYAVLDVVYLIVVYALLRKTLLDKSRMEWLAEDCNVIVDEAGEQEDFNDYYLKVKSAWKLSSEQLTVLQRLAAWREAKARELNVPRNRLIKERALFDLARFRPSHLAQFKKIEGIAPKTLRQFGEEILDVIDEGANVEESALLARLPGPLSPKQGEHLKALRSFVDGIAQNLEIPIETLMRKKDYEAIIRDAAEGEFNLPTRLKGWRKDIVGDNLLNEMRSLV